MPNSQAPGEATPVDGDRVEAAARRGLRDALRVTEADKGPGLRYFIKRGSTTWYSVGFRSKQAASKWIDSHGDDLEWRVGYLFRLRGDSRDVHIVSRKGEQASV